MCLIAAQVKISCQLAWLTAPHVLHVPDSGGSPDLSASFQLAYPHVLTCCEQA